MNTELKHFFTVNNLKIILHIPTYQYVVFNTKCKHYELIYVGNPLDFEYRPYTTHKTLKGLLKQTKEKNGHWDHHIITDSIPFIEDYVFKKNLEEAIGL